MHSLIPLSLVVNLFVYCTTPAAEKFTLVWSDEFNSNGMPDSTSWNYDIGHGYDGWGNHEVQYYTNTSQNVVVNNGSLIIKAVKKDGKWTSARLKTHGKKSWTYGKFVFRAKLPTGRGTWPALWMLGDNISTVGWPACGEIDIMEHVGRNPAIVQSALHTPASHGETINKNSITVDTYSTEFHLYEALWTKEKIEFFVDGNSFYTYAPAERDTRTWPYDAPFFLLLNIAIGGGFGGEVDPALDSAQMEVDYIRVYSISKL